MCNLYHPDVDPAIANLLLDTQVNRTDRNVASTVIRAVATLHELEESRPIFSTLVNLFDDFRFSRFGKLCVVHLLRS